MQAALATFNAAYALFELLNIHAGEYGDCDCEWVNTRAPNSQRHLLRATYVALPPCPPLATSSLSTWTWVFRPKCSLLYNTHNYRQIEATNSLATHTHTHAHIWRAGSLANANDPTHFGPTPTHPAGTYVAVAAPAAAAEAEVRTRSRTWASCSLPTPLYLLHLCQATPLQFSTTPCPVSLWSVGMRSLLGAAVVVGGWRRRRRRLCSISKYERIIQTYIYRCEYVCAYACVCVLLCVFSCT